MIIESELNKKLKKALETTAELIKESIKKKTPIIIRHHSDADGYASAIALERAIQPLIYQAHTKERDSIYYYRRSALLAPMYTNEDVNRDISQFTNERIPNPRPPLLIILDTGTGEEDVLALKKAKVYGAKILIIDHHHPSKNGSTNGDLVINPHFFGSEYDMCAGMISAELANILNPKTDGLPVIAAIAAAGDKVDSKEAHAYFDIAKKEGYEKSDLLKIAQILDFESYSLGFVESRVMINDLFGADKKKQSELINIIYPFIEKKKKEALDVGLKYTRIEKKGNKVIAIIPLFDISIRGEYPPAGRISGVIHDYYKKQYSNLVTLGVLNDSIVLRAGPDSDFDSNKVIKALQDKMPHALINGGGHKKAAGLRFIPVAREDVLKEIKNLI